MPIHAHNCYFDNFPFCDKKLFILVLPPMTNAFLHTTIIIACNMYDATPLIVRWLEKPSKHTCSYFSVFYLFSILYNTWLS